MFTGKYLHFRIAIFRLIPHHEIQSPENHPLQLFGLRLFQEPLIALNQLQDVALEQFKHVFGALL